MPASINLLPKYVTLRKIFRRLLIVCIAGSVLWAIILLLVYANKQVELKTIEASTANVEPAAKATEAAQAAKKKADDAKAPMDANVQFILEASQTGAQRRAMLDLFRPYVYKESVVSEIDVSDGQTAKIKAMVQSPDDYARFIMSLRQGTAPTGPLFAGLPVGTNGVPGYPSERTNAQGGDNAETATSPEGEGPEEGGNSTAESFEPKMVVFPLTASVQGKLLNPVTVPTAPGGAPAAQNNTGDEDMLPE